MLMINVEGFGQDKNLHVTPVKEKKTSFERSSIKDYKMPVGNKKQLQLTSTR